MWAWVKVVRVSFLLQDLQRTLYVVPCVSVRRVTRTSREPHRIRAIQNAQRALFRGDPVSNCDGFGPSDIEAPASWTSATVEAMVASWEELKRSPETFVAVAEADGIRSHLSQNSTRWSSRW